jgi:hypothetical protein
MNSLRLRLTTWTRRAAVGGTATVAAAAAVLLPAAAAHASGNGTGWSSYWSYYTDTSFKFGGTLPGVSLDGFGYDGNGTRQSVNAVLQDTARDGLCARAIATNANGIAFDGTVCDGQPPKYFYPAQFRSSLAFYLVQAQPNGTVKTVNATVVPDSTPDPTLRTTGTGVSWSYYAPFNFQFDVHRRGVDFAGYGGVSGTSNRWAAGTVYRQDGSTCSQAWLTDGRTSSVGTACSSSTWGSVPVGYFSGGIGAHACAFGLCVDGTIPDPYS